MGEQNRRLQAQVDKSQAGLEKLRIEMEKQNQNLQAEIDKSQAGLEKVRKANLYLRDEVASLKETNNKLMEIIENSKFLTRRWRSDEVSSMIFSREDMILSRLSGLYANLVVKDLSEILQLSHIIWRDSDKFYPGPIIPQASPMRTSTQANSDSNSIVLNSNLY